MLRVSESEGGLRGGGGEKVSRSLFRFVQLLDEMVEGILRFLGAETEVQTRALSGDRHV